MPLLIATLKKMHILDMHYRVLAYIKWEEGNIPNLKFIY